MPQLARYVCRLPNVTVPILFYRCKGNGWGLLSPHPRRLRYDSIGHLVSDGCNLGSALVEHEQLDNLCGLGRGRYHTRELRHNLGERERLTVRVSCRELFGCCTILKRRLRRSFGLCRVLLEDVELVRDLTVEVLDCMDVCLIGIAHDLADKVVGYALSAALRKDGEHLVVGELELSASGSHELTPIRPRDASEPPFGSFFSVPFGQLLLYYCIDFLARTILKIVFKIWKPQVDDLVFSDSQNIGTVAR